MKELVKITELNPTDVEQALESIMFHNEMAFIFLSAPNKRNWILRRLAKIKGDSLFNQGV